MLLTFIIHLLASDVIFAFPSVRCLRLKIPVVLGTSSTLGELTSLNPCIYFVVPYFVVYLNLLHYFVMVGCVAMQN